MSGSIEGKEIKNKAMMKEWLESIFAVEYEK
jgi:hypothetical protein